MEPVPVTELSAAITQTCICLRTARRAVAPGTHLQTMKVGVDQAFHDAAKAAAEGFQLQHTADELFWEFLTDQAKGYAQSIAFMSAFALIGAIVSRGGANTLAPRPVPSLAKYNGGKTSGVLRFGEYDVPLLSGYKGPSASMPRGTPGMNGNIKSHVEAHAAAIMRQQGLQEATLYINRIPCPGNTGCDAMLPRMLPEGARLRVIGPGGFERIYVGLPD